jgi:hypothetical protein
MITLYLGLFLAALAVLGYCLYQAFMIVREVIVWIRRRDSRQR